MQNYDLDILMFSRKNFLFYPHIFLAGIAKYLSFQTFFNMKFHLFMPVVCSENRAHLQALNFDFFR